MLEYSGHDDNALNLRVGPGDTLRRVHGVNELRQAILMLLMTRPGERRLAPEFGCPLDRLLFEPLDDTTAGMAVRLVADAVKRHEPRARIDRLDAGPDPTQQGQLRITLDFTDTRNGETGQTVVSLPTGGAE